MELHLDTHKKGLVLEPLNPLSTGIQQVFWRVIPRLVSNIDGFQHLTTEIEERGTVIPAGEISR